MSRAIEKYLDHVLIYANRNEKDSDQIRAELRDHLLEKMAGLEAEGLSREDAIFEAIEQHGHARRVGYGFRKRFPLLDVRSEGTARGFIAVGPRAIGVIAFGGVAVGFFAFGGLALGVIAFGGLALALLISSGAMCGALCVAFGFLAVGGWSMGIIAVGGMAIGAWVPAAVYSVPWFSGEAAPQFLPVFSGMFGRKDEAVIVSFVFMMIIPSLFVLMRVLKGQEYKRMKAEDPSLVE